MGFPPDTYRILSTPNNLKEIARSKRSHCFQSGWSPLIREMLTKERDLGKGRRKKEKEQRERERGQGGTAGGGEKGEDEGRG